MSRIFDALQNARDDAQSDETVSGNLSRAPRLELDLTPIASRRRQINRVDETRFYPLLDELRTLRSDERGCVVALAGLRGGEGTTTIAEALADFIARTTGTRILLLSAGDSELTKDVIPMESRFNRQPDRFNPQLNRNSLPYTPATLLLDPTIAMDGNVAARADRFLKTVALDYDWVILDCPPTLSSATGTVTAAQADAAVLIVESERNSTAELRQAEQRLQLADANVIGIVMNRRQEHVPGLIRRLFDRLGFTQR